MPSGFEERLISGDYSEEDPPVPISNTVVKLVNAESTWLEAAWEDRKSLIKLKKANQMVSLFCYIYLHVESDQRT